MSCKGEGKEKLILDELLTKVFIEYDMLSVPEGKPDILKAKKELLQRLKVLEKTLGSISSS